MGPCPPGSALHLRREVSVTVLGCGLDAHQRRGAGNGASLRTPEYEPRVRLRDRAECQGSAQTRDETRPYVLSRLTLHTRTVDGLTDGASVQPKGVQGRGRFHARDPPVLQGESGD